MTSVEATVVVPAECIIGEGPTWHPTAQALYWVDIAGRAVHVHHPASGSHERIPVDDEIGVLCRWTDSAWIAAGRRGVYRLELPSGRIEAVGDPEAADPESRFNDGKVDRRGRLWAGTMTPSGARSSLYRVDADRTVQRIDGPFTISNGIAWSTDGASMYFVDSMRFVIHRYEFDEATGEVGARQELIAFRPDDGIPDGITVDDTGDIWCAMYGGASVLRIRPDGTVRARYPLPVTQPTSCAFGGADYDILYVSSARNGLDAGRLAAEPAAGSLFAIRPGVRGRPEPAFETGAIG